MGKYSDLLFARPSFLEGVGRLFDLGGTLNRYNFIPDPEIADRVALRMDWEAVAEDFRTVMQCPDLEEQLRDQDQP